MATTSTQRTEGRGSVRLVHKVTQALALRCVRTDAGIELESILALRYVMSFSGQADASVSSELKKHVLN